MPPCRMSKSSLSLKDSLGARGPDFIAARSESRIENRLLTMAPAEVAAVQLTIADFGRFRDN